MDTISGISKNAAKKRRQRENRANSATPAIIADTSMPAIIAPNTSDATTAATDTSEYPDKKIVDLWRLAAVRAARKAWQRNYVEKQAWLKAEATPQPLWNIWSDLRQTAENYYHKQLFRTAPIAVYAIVEPTTATSPTPTEDDMNTVEKVDAELLRMEKNWAETRSGPFPEGIRNAMADLRAALEKPDSETEPASEQFESANDVRHVTAAAITTTITAPANAATTTTIPTPVTATTLAAFDSTPPVATPLRTSTTAPAPISTPAPAHSPNSSPIATFESDTATPAQTPTTTADSNPTTTTIEPQHDEEQTVGIEEENERSTEGEEDERQQRREKEGKGMEKEDGASERKNERREAIHETPETRRDEGGER